MIWVLLADAVMGLHLAFILFAVFGGLLALRWPRAMLLHLPAAAYAVLISFVGWYCPLTPLENWLRRAGGQSGYDTGFIEHYLEPVIYPVSFGRGMQILLGTVALGMNLAIYARVIVRRGPRKG